MEFEQPLKPGQLLLIPREFAHIQFYKEQIPFTRLDDGRAFAVNGLNGKPTFFIHGVLGIEFQKFNHPKMTYFVESFTVNNPPIQKAVALRLPSSTWKEPSQEQMARMKSERLQVQKILQNHSTPLIRTCWRKPVESVVTSRFASPRTLPSGRSYFHTGLDLRAHLGRPVYAAGEGRVVFAEEHFVPGKMVIVDHGGGLFTRYMHLDKFEVNVGDIVQAGDLIGRAGATGRVEAPHLHWEVVWKENYADPLKFLQSWEQICDPKSVESI